MMRAVRSLVLGLLVVAALPSRAAAQLPDIPTPQDLLGKAVEDLADSVEDKAKEKVLGVILGAIGLGPDDSGLKEVQNQLADIQAQITDLSDYVKDADAQLGCSINSGVYNTVLSGTNSQTMITVAQLGGFLKSYVDSKRNNDATQAANMKSLILSTIQNQPTLAADINALAAGNPSLGTAGAVKLYSRAIVACQKFFNSESSRALARQWDYLALLQANACTLMVNYFTSQGDTLQAGKTVSACQQYVSTLNGLKLPDAVAQPEVIDTTTNTMWYVGGPARNHCFHIKNGCVVNLASIPAGYALPTTTDVQAFVSQCNSAGDQPACMKKAGIDTALPLANKRIIFWARNPAVTDFYDDAINKALQESNGISHADYRNLFDPLRNTGTYCVTAFSYTATDEDYIPTPCAAVHVSGVVNPWVGYLNPGPQASYVLLSKAVSPVQDGQYYWF